jgi:hypothetical protein
MHCIFNQPGMGLAPPLPLGMAPPLPLPLPAARQPIMSGAQFALMQQNYMQGGMQGGGMGMQGSMQGMQQGMQGGMHQPMQPYMNNNNNMFYGAPPLPMASNQGLINMYTNANGNAPVPTPYNPYPQQ